MPVYKEMKKLNVKTAAVALMHQFADKADRREELDKLAYVGNGVFACAILQELQKLELERQNEEV